MLGTKDTTVGRYDGLGCRSDRSATSKTTSATQADTVGDRGRGWSGAEMVMDRVTVAEAADRRGVTRDAGGKRIKRGSKEWEVEQWS